VPKTKKNTYAKPRQKRDLTCCGCTKTKKDTDFYSSYNPLHGTGKLPYCKDCIQNMCLDNKGNISIEKLQETLKLIDRPFIEDLWKISVEENSTKPIGIYFKNLGLSQNRKLTWKDSCFIDNSNKNNSLVDGNIIVDETLITSWGQNWQPDEYIRLESFYRSMVDINKPETPQDKDYIKKIARLSLQIDKAIESGDSKTAKSLGDLYSKYMSDAKLRTSDMSEADKAGGIRRFCDIFTEVERDDFIPPWEYYRKINGAKQDIVDKSIMFILNFMLKFNKSEKLSQIPVNTPIIEDDEIDDQAQSSIELEDLEVIEYE
jgi:hypothetical protein